MPAAQWLFGLHSLGRHQPVGVQQSFRLAGHALPRRVGHRCRPLEGQRGATSFGHPHGLSVARMVGHRQLEGREARGHTLRIEAAEWTSQVCQSSCRLRRMGGRTFLPCPIDPLSLSRGDQRAPCRFWDSLSGRPSPCLQPTPSAAADLRVTEAASTTENHDAQRAGHHVGGVAPSPDRRSEHQRIAKQHSKSGL